MKRDVVFIGMLALKVKTGKTGWLGDILVSLSLANLMLVTIWIRLIYSNSYFVPTVTWYNWLSVVILLLLFAFVLILALRLLRATNTARWQLVFLVLLGVSLLIALDGIRVISDVDISIVFDGIREIYYQDPVYYPWTGLIIIVILAIILFIRNQIIPIVYVLLLILSPFTFVNLFHTAVNMTPLLINHSDNHEKTYIRNNIAATPKTVYIIFDELDYRIFIKQYVENQKYINLKNFNYIRENGLFFTNVKNMWDATVQAIPSITTGDNVKVQPLTLPSPDIELTFPTGNKRLWSASDTLFRSIKNNGQDIGIIGWHHRYCEIFSDITSYCADQEIRRNFTETLKITTLRIIPYYRSIEYQINHKITEKNTFNVLGNNFIDFIYIHDSIPHFPGIWDAKLKKYSMNILSKITANCSKLYFHNVQLADDFLGRIIDRMKEKGIWDGSTLIIGSDHRWRQPPDKPLENIPLLIKFPLQKTGYQYDKEVLPTQIKAMIEQIAVHKVHDPVAFMAWLNQQLS